MSCKDNYLLVAMHSASGHTLKNFWEAKPGAKKLEEVEKQGYHEYEHKNEYTIIFTEIDKGYKKGPVAKIKEIVDKKRLNKKNTFALLHGDDRPFSNIPDIGIPSSQIELFSGETSIAGNFSYSILDALMEPSEESIAFPTWIEIKRFFQVKWPEFLVQNLTPLYLALQVFFGISKDEDNKWKCIPDDLPGEVKSIFSAILSAENRKKAFLLVKEAEYDFFAEIGNRFQKEETSDSEEKPMEERTILNLIKKLSDDKEIKNRDFLDIDRKKIDGYDLELKLKDIISNSEELKMVCSILANIADDGISPLILKKPEQPPEVIKKLEALRNRISASRRNLAEIPACKKWFEENPPTHKKWPIDIENNGEQPHESYWNLVKQLEEWSPDGTRARAAIEQIETMAYYLFQIGECMREKQNTYKD